VQLLAALNVGPARPSGSLNPGPHGLGK